MTLNVLFLISHFNLCNLYLLDGFRSGGYGYLSKKDDKEYSVRENM